MENKGKSPMKKTNQEAATLEKTDKVQSSISWKKDAKAIILIFFMYLNQSMISGFLFITIPVNLMSKGAAYRDLILITFSYLPLCFKPLFASWMDAYYVKSFGKRKTYYVPSQYIIGLTLLFLSTHGERLLELESIPLLSLISIFVVFMTIFSDVSIDGWMVSLISSANSSYGSTAQGIGWNVGFFLAYNFFTPLNSLEFCNEYLYSTPGKEPIMSTGAFMRLIVISTFGITLCTQFLLKEKEETEKPKKVSEQSNEKSVHPSTIQMLKVLIKNKNFRKLLFIYITWNLFFGPVHNELLMANAALEKGVAKETYTNINAPMIPINILLTFLLGNLCKNHPETKLAKIFWIFRLACSFFIFGTLAMLETFPSILKILTLFVSLFCSNLSFIGVIVTLGTFANRVSRETYGGPLMSTFGSLVYAHRFISDVLLHFAMQQLGWNQAAIVSLIGMVLYSFVFIKEINYFENKNLKALLMPKEKGI